MPGAGGGLVRASAYLLTNINGNTTVVANPLTGYGIIGANDSGGFLTEAIGWKKWTFQLIGTLTGVSVSLYGTIDPAAYDTFIKASQGLLPPGTMTPQGYTNAAGYVPGLPPSSWSLLPGPSEQGGTGTISNPVSNNAPFFESGQALIAVRAVVTASAGATGTGSVVCFATP